MHSVAQNDACTSVMNDESPDRHGRGFRRVSNISVHDLLGDSLLQQGAGGDANAVGCRNLDGLAGARVASGAGGALDALSGEQAGQLQAFAGLHRLDEHVLESVHSCLSLCLGQVGLLSDLRDEIRLVVCHKASFLGQGTF